MSPVVSKDLTDVYLLASDGAGLYRYDISSGTLSFVAEISPQPRTTSHPLILSLGEISPDGRYFYFEGAVAGLPGSGVMRYDSAENVIECVSCASPFDPEPTQPAFLNNNGDSIPTLSGGLTEYSATSGNGDFAFFTTPAALVPQDVNGEIEIYGGISVNGENYDYGRTTSPSSDIYEWRKDGIDGCAHLQGCLALITDGRGGVHDLLLGSADEGRDVLVYTLSKLLPQDIDSAGDIYDARIDGGFAPAPSRPVECEGDACSNPPAPPNDATPSSSTFSGAGNLVPEVATSPPAKKPVVSKKKKTKKKPKKKGKTKGRKRAKKSNQRRGK